MQSAQVSPKRYRETLTFSRDELREPTQRSSRTVPPLPLQQQPQSTRKSQQSLQAAADIARNMPINVERKRASISGPLYTTAQASNGTDKSPPPPRQQQQRTISPVRKSESSGNLRQHLSSARRQQQSSKGALQEHDNDDDHHHLPSLQRATSAKSVRFSASPVRKSSSEVTSLARQLRDNVDAEMTRQYQRQPSASQTLVGERASRPPSTMSLAAGGARSPSPTRSLSRQAGKSLSMNDVSPRSSPTHRRTKPAPTTRKKQPPSKTASTEQQPQQQDPRPISRKRPGSSLVEPSDKDQEHVIDAPDYAKSATLDLEDITEVAEISRTATPQEAPKQVDEQEPQQAEAKEAEAEEEEEEEEAATPPERDETDIDETKYPATRMQEYIHQRMMESPDQPRYADQDETSTFIRRAWYTDTPLSLPLLRICVLRVMVTYPVLRTSWFRNARIIDADLHGMIDTLSMDVDVDLVEEVAMQSDRHSRSEQLELMDQHMRRWARSATSATAFRLFVFGHCLNMLGDASIEDTGTTTQGSVLGLALSESIGDELSVSVVLHQVLRNYQHCLERLYPNIAVHALPLGAYTILSTDQLVRCRRFPLLPSIDAQHDFRHHAYQEQDDMPLLPKRLSYFRSQCFETKQESVDPRRRQFLEAEVIRMETELANVKTQRQALISKRAELEERLRTAEMNLAKIDADKNSGRFFLYTDSETGETLQIGRDAQKILHHMLLGDDVPDSADDDQSQLILVLLSRHQISPPSMDKLTGHTLQTFVSLTEEDLLRIGVVTKEKRKILALTTFVRNRIRECIDEQSRLRYALERSIIKSKRDVNSATEGLTTATSSIERLAASLLKYQALLNPPIVEVVIPMLNIPFIGEGKTPHNSLNELYVKGSRESLDRVQPQDLLPARLTFQDVTIPEATVTNLQRYFAEWKAARRRKLRASRALNNAGQGAQVDLGSDDEDDALSTSFLPQSLVGLLFATFVVLLKHISGKDLFVLGLRTSQRKAYFRSPVHLGPLTQTLPVRIDLRESSVQFEDLLASVTKLLETVQKQSPGVCGAELMDTIRSEIVTRRANKESALELDDSIDPMAYDFKVLFDYVDADAMDRLRSLGLSLDDVTGVRWMDPSTAATSSNRPFIAVQPLLLPSATSGDHDLVFQLVEDSSRRQICGVLWHREDIPDHAVRKWVAKFQHLTENFDAFALGKKMTVSMLISRFYHSVWGGGVATDAAGRTFSVKELRESLNDLLDTNV
ncbi:hypothetical protein RI367_005570 [Sorochytrium milnesiophthora]